MHDMIDQIGLEADTLERGSRDKLDAARLLLEKGFFTEAYYLAGYAVEFALKARIARRFRADTIPDLAFVRGIYTHDLDALARQAGVIPNLKQAADTDDALRFAWETARLWTSASRYASADMTRAAAYIQAVGGETGSEGFLGWLKTAP